jgi:mRNA-degrading endonuclease RelE of RelBE toxin-antitoxin system
MITVIKAVSFGATDYPISIAELKSASRVLDDLLSEQEHRELVDALAFNPEAGDVIPGTMNRLRKMRWSYGSKGKRGGIRIVYFFYDLNMPLYIVAVYQRKEALRITKSEEKLMLKVTEDLIASHAKRIESLRSRKTPA